MKKRIIYLIFGLIGIGVGMGALPSLWDLIGWSANHFLNNLLIDGLICHYLLALGESQCELDS